MMSKTLLLAAAGALPAMAAPLSSQLYSLTPEQIKAGCTLNMVPPIRPECHAAAPPYSVHAGATPDPDPGIDLGCEVKGHIIPCCHLYIGGHKFHVGLGCEEDASGEPPLPSDNPGMTMLPNTSDWDGSGNRTIYVVPSTNETSTVQTATMVPGRPVSQAASTTSPSQMTSSSAPSPSSAPQVSSSAHVSTLHSSASPTYWTIDGSILSSSRSSTAPTASMSSSSPAQSTSASLTTSSDSSVGTSSLVITDISSTTTSSSSSSHMPSSTEVQSMVSSSALSAGPTSSSSVTSQSQIKDQETTQTSQPHTLTSQSTQSSSLGSMSTSTPESSHTSSSSTATNQTTTTQTGQSSSSSSITSPTPTSGHSSLTLTTTQSTTTQTGQHSSSVSTSALVSSTGHTSLSSSTSQPTTSPTGPSGTTTSSSSTSLDPAFTILTGTRQRTASQKSTTVSISHGPGYTILTGTVSRTVSEQASTSPSPTSKASETIPTALSTTSTVPPSPTETDIPLEEEVHRHITAVIDGVGSEDDKDKKRLAMGLGIGLGAGIPTFGLVKWMSKCFRTISTLAKSGNVATAVTKAINAFRAGNFHFPGGNRPGGANRPGGGGNPASEVAESVDEWYDELCRKGNTGEQAAEIINNFKADMQAAEAAMADQAVEVESVVDAAAGRTFSNPNILNSWGVQAAAQLASTPGAGAKEIANSLLKAGVPAEAVSSTAEAVAHSVSEAGKGWIGRPAYNAALGVISSSVTSAGMAGSEAAKAAVKGASNAGLAWSLGPAGVPKAAAAATATAVNEAIQAAQASGADPVIAAINVISQAASPAGLASAAALDGATGSSLAPALSAAGVPTEALGATADAVSAAISANGDSASGALNAAAGVIASASVPGSEGMSSPSPPVSPAQGALDVVGATFNFWHTVPWVVWDTLNELKDNGGLDWSEMEGLDSLLAMGPPPDFSSRFATFPYRRDGNRVTGQPSLEADDTSSSIPSSTDQGTQSGTQLDNATQPVTPTLPPAPPGTGGYYIDDGDYSAPTKQVENLFW